MAELTVTKSKIKRVQKVSQTQRIIPRCPHCGSINVYGISRVVGYFSRIDNWNKSKQAELRDRQKGNYKVTN
jgi:ribonucleoside-triphosphate reductase